MSQVEWSSLSRQRIDTPGNKYHPSPNPPPPPRQEKNKKKKLCEGSSLLFLVLGYAHGNGKEKTYHMVNCMVHIPSSISRANRSGFSLFFHLGGSNIVLQGS